MSKQNRDYKQERVTLLARGEDKGHADRNAVRRAAVKAGIVKTGDGKDLDHKRPIVKGGAGRSLSNVRVTTPSSNRSFPRTKKAGMK
jgi:hypothetical protein